MAQQDMEIIFFQKKMPYMEVNSLFENVKNKNRNAVEEKIYILEHENVYTAGKSVLNSNEVFKEKIADIPTVYSERGGLWTWHGVGQVVVYFVYDLRKHKKTISDFMADIERSVITSVNDELNKYGVKKNIASEIRIFARQDKRGFWCKNLKNGEIAKFGFIGLRVKNGFVTHGISVNYNNDLSYFDFINPCGLGDVKITSIQEIVKSCKNRTFDSNDFDICEFKKTLGNNIFNVINARAALI